MAEETTSMPASLLNCDVEAMLDKVFGQPVVITPAPFTPRALDPAPDIAPPSVGEPPPDLIEDAILVEEEPVAESDVPRALHFVTQRTTAEWDTGARICEVVRGTLEEAEAVARGWKQKFPHQHFGVAPLVSEVRTVEDPLEVVRMQ